MPYENGGWLGNTLNSGQGGIQDLLKTIRQQQQELTAKPAYNPNTFNAQDYLGSQFGFGMSEYKKMYESGDPAIEKQGELALKQLGIQSRKAKAGIEEKGAQSGFRGANANLYNQLLETETNATQQITNQTALAQSGVKRDALGQLMGLSQFEGQTKFGVAQQNENVRQYEKTFQENVRQFGLSYALQQRELDLKEQEASGSFGGFLGDLLGTAVGFATGGIGSGLGSWVGNELFG